MTVERSRAKLTLPFPSRGDALRALFVATVGIFFLFSPLGDPFVNLSFDLPSLFTPAVPANEIVVVTIDETTLSDQDINGGIEQREPVLRRSAHARLLDKLRVDGARMAVFDILFKGETPEDAILADAIERFRHVILGANVEVTTGEILGFSLIQPADIFKRLPSYRFGLVSLDPDQYSDHVVRQFPAGLTNAPVLSVVAAEALGRTIRRPSHEAPRFIRYYGGSNALQSERFQDALGRPLGYFTNKTVLIGGKPKIDFIGVNSDLYFTPFTRWTRMPMRGVEIHATMLLNLLHDEQLTRLGEPTEFLLVLAFGVLAAIGLSRVSPRRGVVLGASAAIVITIAAVAIFCMAHLWFDWLLLVAVQLPAAWAAAAIAWVRRPQPAREREEYEFLEQVGAGGFGEVWLARNTPTGAFRAIKRVYRTRFSEQRPFEREFEGLRNFELSRLVHPGWVRVLHVSKNDAEGYFYYAMEPADDLVTGSDIRPGDYTPKTLGRVLVEKAWLPASECISIGIQMADALAALHKLGMVHRDVKPSNIIFVRGVPKLADIGLIASADANLTAGGTRGFAPETDLGTPAADICALGRTLYQAATGCPPEKYPSLPTGLEKRADARELMRLMDVIVKACEISCKDRYESAEQLRDDLIRLQMV